MNDYNFKFTVKMLFVFATLACGASQLFAKPPVKELVLYYPRTAVNDCSGYNNNGKATAIVASNSPSLVSMQQTRQLTIAVWIKPDSLSREFPVVLSKGGNESPGAYGGYELLLNANGDNDLVFTSGTCEITTYGANGRWINNHLGEWVHVAFTINDNTKGAKFYVNGLPTNDEFDFNTYFNSTTPLNFDLPNNLYVGAPDPASNVNRSKFDGSMSELMIFNRALTAKEIGKIFSSNKPPQPKS